MKTRRHGRLLPAALIFAVAGLSIAAIPSAANASLIAASNGLIVYVAQPDVGINVDFFKVGSNYRVTEFNTTIEDVDGPGGCGPQGTTQMICPVAGISSIVVIGGHGNDYANVDGNITIAASMNLANGVDTALGGSGPDTLNTGANNDFISGNNGDDVINGGLGADTMIGNAGTNTVSYAGRSTGVTIDLSLPGFVPQQEGDIVNLFQNVDGGAGNDTLTGSNSPNVLKGGAGNDLLRGKAGVDWLLGEAGDDQMNGDAETDILIGGTGNDLYGAYPPDPGADAMFDELLTAFPGGGSNSFLSYGDSASDTIRCAPPTSSTNQDLVVASNIDLIGEPADCDAIWRVGS